MRLSEFIGVLQDLQNTLKTDPEVVLVDDYDAYYRSIADVPKLQSVVKLDAELYGEGDGDEVLCIS